MMFLVLAIMLSYIFYWSGYHSGYARGETDSDNGWEKEAIRRGHGVRLQSARHGSRFVWVK